MTDWNAIQAFMANVVAWPASAEDAGWVNMHYSFPSRDDPKVLVKRGGWPKKSLESFVSSVSFALKSPARYKDIWYCTSLQSETKTNTKGKLQAHRLKANAMKMKAIWVDVDVDDDPKHYHTIPDALKAVLEFQVKVGLPPPSAIVFSGSGIHIYWISKDELTPAEWHPYADGLKQLLLANNILCDAGLTTDAARILRVPGTLNYKTDPPKPVTLAPGPLKLYDFPAKLAFLQQFAGPVIAAAPKAGFTLWADGVTGATFGKPHPAFAAFMDEPGLEAGIDKNADLKLDPRPIFKKCGFYREALKTGGSDYDQALWMYSILGTTFMENGNEIAHKISSGHVTYSALDTQAMYDRKVADRASAGIGYPSCAAIAGAGCEACKTCPLFKDGKSPLNIKPPPITATVNPAVQSQHAIDACIPFGFDFNADGIICKVIETEDEGETNVAMIPLFQAVLTDFWLQKHPGEYLNFTTTVDKGFTEQVTIPLGEISTQGFSSFLGKQRVLIDVRGERYLKEYFLSTIGKLRALAAAHEAVPFGWYLDNGVRRGFAYAGKVMLDDGTERPCGAVDPNIQRSYRPKGDMAQWMKAANCLLDRQRPELTTIALTAFAAPLMGFTDHNSFMVSAVGTDSGAGKSSAAKVGMSVWGDPLLTKGTETQTKVNVTTIMKTIRNLPFYWDEISGEKQHEKIAEVMMEADGGKERGRNLNARETQASGSWQLMLVHTANPSLKEYLRKTTKNTSAKLMRCLEYEVKRVDGGPGSMQSADADVLMALTRHNHGLMGEVYAKYLAINHKRIQQEVTDKCREIEALLKAKNDERFWTTGIALLCLGAAYARDCGLNVDPVEIEKFLYRTYEANLLDRDAFATGGKVDNSESAMTRYLKERYAGERGIWTNYMHNSQGKPPKPVMILKGPTTPRNPQGGIEFRFAVENKQLILAQEDFDEWIGKKGHSLTQIHASLTNVYSMKRQRLQLCSGTIHDPGREWCLVLDIQPHTPLWDYMTNYTNADDKMKLEAGDDPEPIETGLGEAASAS